MHSVEVQVMKMVQPTIMCVAMLADDEIECITQKINIPVTIDGCEFKIISLCNSFRSEETNTLLLSKILNELETQVKVDVDCCPRCHESIWSGAQCGCFTIEELS
jgi:hypothetical protein